LGGEFHIQSRAPVGTRIVIKIPYSREAEADNDNTSTAG